MIVAVPLGVSFAIGLDRWRGRLATGANFMMLVTFVLPEIVIGIAMLLVVTYLFTFIQLGTLAQLMGLITFQISYPVIIVRARLLSIGKEYEEAGMDLGATPNQSVRRVLLPLLYPAILASFAIVFADTVDDFVTVTYLSGPANSQPLSTFIYVTARASATPAVNAAATLMLVSTTLVICLGYLAFKRLTRGQEGGDVTAFSQHLGDTAAPLRCQGIGDRTTARRALSSRGSACRCRAAPAARRAASARRRRCRTGTGRPCRRSAPRPGCARRSRGSRGSA